MLAGWLVSLWILLDMKFLSAFTMFFSFYLAHSSANLYHSFCSSTISCFAVMVQTVDILTICSSPLHSSTVWHKWAFESQSCHAGLKRCSGKQHSYLPSSLITFSLKLHLTWPLPRFCYRASFKGITFKYFKCEVLQCLALTFHDDIHLSILGPTMRENIKTHIFYPLPFLPGSPFLCHQS